MSDAGLLSLRTWTLRAGGRLIIYYGPPLRESPDRALVRRAMRKFGALAAMWQYDYDAPRGPWHSLVCSTPGYCVDNITRKKVRYYVRRSLKSCTVEPVDLAWIADHAYETRIKAIARYTELRPETRAQFERRMRALVDDSAYAGHAAMVDGRLAAYSITVSLGNVLNVAVAKFDPEFAASYPMYALYYTMAHEALTSGRYQYVDNGTRPLLHDTNISDFLLRLDWRKAYCRLGLELHPFARVALGVARPSRPLWARWLSAELRENFDALLKAQEVARQSATGVWPEEASAPAHSDDAEESSA